MSILIDLFGYVLFPGLLGLTLSALYFGPYRTIKSVNQPFEDYRRPPSLQRLMQVLLVCVFSIFLIMQFFRLPFYLSVLTALTDFSVVGYDLEATLKMGISAAVIVAELIVLSHLCTYLVLSWIGMTRFRNPVPGPLPANPPQVAVLIPTCDEDPLALERSVSTVSELRYPNLRILLVENSRKEESKQHAHSVAARYGVEVVDIPNRGHKAGALNDVEALLGDDVKYSVIFDADQRIQADLVSDAVALLEADDELGVIQTPQTYENCQSSLLACAISQQQMLLYDGIIEGKGALRRAPCYGSNFAIRRKTLQDVGGWDETNLTEDLTTSYHIHARGWASLYLRRLYAMGLVPPTLDSYWKQQLRWAKGNTTLFFQLLGSLVRGKLRPVPSSIIVDYLLASSFYVNTFAISIVAICPAVLLTYDLAMKDPVVMQSLTSDSPLSQLQAVSLSLYPLYLVVIFFPYFNMGLRGYPLRNLILLHGLVSITSPVYLTGVRRALFDSANAPFESSTKIAVPQQASHGPLIRTPQAIAFFIFLGAGSLLVHRGVTTSASFVVWILVFWMFIHSLSLSHFFLFRFESHRQL